MSIQHIAFNLSQGIEGVAPNPAQGRSLEVLPQSQQVLPDNSIFTGVHSQSAPWIQGNSLWSTALQQFVTPHIASGNIVPANLQGRLRHIRRQVDKQARKEQSATLRALADALQDDADLQNLLQEYRSALMRV